MARYQFICQCGHSVETSLDVPLAGATQEALLSFQRNCVCPSCHELQHRALVEAPVSTELAEVPEASEDECVLVDLVGSEFQQAWAAGIRKQHLDDYCQSLRSVPDAAQSTLSDLMVSLVNELPRAGWWIDHRYNPMAAIIDTCRDRLAIAALSIIEQHMKSVVRRPRRWRRGL